MELSQELLEFALSHLGSIKNVKARGWKHLETGVWELETEQGRAFLKSHREANKFEQELRAYQEFLPHALKVTPALLGYHQELQAMLLSAVPGELAQAVTTKDIELEIYYQAGQFLRSYHDLPYQDAETLSIEEAFWQRAESWLKRAESLVPAKDIDWVTARVKEILPALKMMKRVPHHRDYTARNWLWSEKLYVIDFEHDDNSEYAEMGKQILETLKSQWT